MFYFNNINSSDRDVIHENKGISDLSGIKSLQKKIQDNHKNFRPDIVIYLQADTDVLMKNIEKRGRNMEKNVTWEYIDALNQVYTEYFFRYQDTPLVIINTNNIDFVENENDLKEVIDYIRQPVSGTKFFNPVTEF